MLSSSNPVPKLYLSVIDDVIDSLRELFLDEGMEERVLEDLRQLWESKVMQSKAVEGFLKDTLNPSNFVLQLPPNYTQTLHKPTASVVIPASQNVQSFTSKANSTASLATFSLPPGVSYPVQIPAGVTLQTSSGHLYKVNVPVMVTQAPGANRILSQPVQHMLDPREPPAPQRVLPPTILHASPPQVKDLYAPPPSAGPLLRPPVAQQQPPQPQPQQQQQVLQNQCARPLPPAAAPPPPAVVQAPVLPPESPGDDQFTLEGIEFSPRLLDAGLATPSLCDFQASSGQTPASGPEVVARGEEAVLKEDVGTWTERAENAKSESPTKLEAGPPLDYNHNALEDMVQLDGACGGSSSEEEEEEEEEEAGEGDGDGMTENEFLGMINAEALRSLQEGEGSTAGGSSDSCSDDADGLAEEEVEEDPLNSGDDVSEQDVPDLFDTDNVVVCQYDKIHRSKNRWKFYLKDGVMCFCGKDYVFSKAVGEAEW
ncbi:TFIIA-alpha and beta-like factor isoform X1 [Anguilla anguilla]|uniref:TFIIA-alpha and beta-like factor isoform X1 n=2 Tax=Anguilla anguilla TaxID=7936 RepID=UPI0015AFE322|nr:TFIIA-alpha and beta-like factor isoform X1 [Anguilla anguilla]